MPNKLKRWFSFNKTLLLSIIISLGLIGISVLLKNHSLTREGIISPNRQPQLGSKKRTNSEVLGRNAQTPQIYIYGENQKHNTGGMIELASTDEPVIVVGGYNVSGDIEVLMYEANEDALLNYLTHDKKANQIKANPDVNQFRYITSVKAQIKADIDNGLQNTSKITLPFEETGIWYLTVKYGSINTGAFVLRSKIGVLTKEGDNELIFWGQNFETKRSISNGTVKLLNLLNGRRELQTASFNNEGIAKTYLNPEADIALVRQDNNLAIVPINLKYLNLDYSYEGYKEFMLKNKATKYFIFTDRPLYKPGDTVYFKAILRDDDDARYTIPKGDALVVIQSGYDHKNSLLKKKYPISSDGTISGQYQLPTDIKTGYYNLSINTSQSHEINSWRFSYDSNLTSFEVEYFRKPEFSINVTAQKNELVTGEKAKFKIMGTYFSGQPLSNQVVKYTIYSTDFYEYQYLRDQQNFPQNLSNNYRYWTSAHNKVRKDIVKLDKNGEAEIDLDTKTPFSKGVPQVLTIEATIADGSQNPAFSKKNILVYAGEYSIYRGGTWLNNIKINTNFSLPITLVPHKEKASVSNINLSAKINRTYWTKYQEPDKKYPSYREEKEDLPGLSAKTDKEGNATFNFTPTKIGLYSIIIEGKDAKGNSILKTFSFYVSSKGSPFYSEKEKGDLTISTDKEKYLPSDTVKLDIFSEIPDRDVFLSLERGRTERFRIIHLNGRSDSVNVSIVNTDMPNIFAHVSSFSNSDLDSNQTKIIVSVDSKKIIVNINPNKKTYGPAETATVDITTTDIEGNPISADFALWAVDKAIFELSDNNLDDVFETFWKERYNTTQEAHSLEGIKVRSAEGGGGCFGAETKVLMANKKTESIKNIKVGDYVLTRSENNAKLIKAKVIKTHSAEVPGYLILNHHLKVTANHILKINNAWKEAESAQVGDTLTNSKGKQIKIFSIEWQLGKTTVYNLGIEKYHTYFAEGVWVHNEKGEERSVFKDTAYWNPSIHTDSSGKAQVNFKLPDNLTTWLLAAVASTTDTQVGQATNEITVNKEIIVRPILPNILRQEDEIVLSALVQNFTQAKHTFDVNLKFDSGNVKKENQKDIRIKSNGMEQLYWKVKPDKENDKSKLTFSAQAEDNGPSDIVTKEVPVKAFGFEEKKAETGEGAKTFKVNFAKDNDRKKSEVKLLLSPTIIGNLPTSMKYLLNYPYGCVEQTTSSLVPAIIAKKNPGLFTEALKDKNVDDIIKKGILKLSDQQSYGGWGWWSSRKPSSFVTAYVVEYLLQAKNVGAKVDEDMLEGVKTYLKAPNYNSNNSTDEKIAKIYVLTLLKEKDGIEKITDFNNVSPDILSLAVMANYLNGYTNPQTNGLDELISRAQTQGDGAFWKAGIKENFGSIDASTALAIRAIMLANGDRNLVSKGVKYLIRTHKSYYWSNTYATAQIIRALVDFSKIKNEITPNYTYTVSLDGKQIAQGRITNPKQVIKEINIPSTDIKKDGSNITIAKNGDGQIYSTLVIKEFHTDRNAKAVNHGLSVKREYINEKGPEHTIGVGDIVDVKITIDGLKANEKYGVIADELPSGLSPINQSFKNEQYGKKSYSPYYYSPNITENGMVLSIYQMDAGKKTYTYKARVINEGKFIAPPATASLMYAPEIYGRSEAQTLTIDSKSHFNGKRNIINLIKSWVTKSFNKFKIIFIVILKLYLLLFYYY